MFLGYPQTALVEKNQSIKYHSHQHKVTIVLSRYFGISNIRYIPKTVNISHSYLQNVLVPPMKHFKNLGYQTWALRVEFNVYPIHRNPS